MIFNLLRAAKDIFYNNSVTGVTATNVQSAIDQVADYRARITMPAGSNIYDKYVNARLGVTIFTPSYRCAAYSPTGADGAFAFVCIRTEELLYGCVFAFNSDNSLAYIYNPARKTWRQITIV